MCILNQRYPCGHCYECLSKRRSDWSIRLREEYKSKGRAYHAILTYNDEHLPFTKNGIATVNKKDCQDFIKRLRYYFKDSFTYFLAAEYGEYTQRPHYHIIIFSESDLIPTANTKRFGKNLYCESFRKLIEKAWQNGFVRKQSKVVTSTAQLHYITKDIYHWTSPVDLNETFNKLKSLKNKDDELSNFLKNTYKAFFRSGFQDDRAECFRLFSKNLGIGFLDSRPSPPDYILERYRNCFIPRFSDGSINKCPKGYEPVGDFYVSSWLLLYLHFNDVGELIYPDDIAPYLDDYHCLDLVFEDGKTHLEAKTYALPRYYRKKSFNYDMNGFVYLKTYFKQLKKRHEYFLSCGKYDNEHETPYWLLQAQQKFNEMYKSHKDRYSKKFRENETIDNKD